ncbi:MAG TPA: hypothetical protein VFZ61_01620 [Polyangiales bacterium]
MIVHVSLPADDCKYVAHVLAELMRGRALRFPPGGADAWNAWSLDARTQIVVTPRGHCMLPGTSEMEWTVRAGEERGYETHLALCVPRPVEEILEIAARTGWTTRVCDRGGMFHVVELWLENAYLVELLDPAFAAEYERTMTVDSWQRQFGV